ncbi:hypothetical protein OCK74_00375 [Chitinophagaceae bacterium LB-8]|uniref:Uncharacterized protein n=1 Tax=Paraflavisolibacter caeni TaxID=2982496 RepID=A0A9X2XSK0_9BACT|nr:hypothetical protein [Paraflavisolibacter caeni]MCU7547542.1 hypothetical protein [Paraflavisolibacter caeni]
MKPSILLCSVLLALLLIAGLLHKARAQQGGCVPQDLIAHIDFGRGDNVQDFNTFPLSNYGRIWGGCPTDGHYTFTSYTSNCFEGDWFTLTEDHTPGDTDGNMLLVNAYPGGGVFFHRTISGLTGNKTYELALWLINVCRLHICCSSLSPVISFSLATPSGKNIASFRLGELEQRTSPQWRKSVSYFTMPAGETSVVLTMQDNAIGGCGNDFALDDISVRECIPLQPIVKAKPKQSTTPVVKKPTDIPKPEMKKEQVKQPVIKTAEKPAPVLKSSKDSPVHVLTVPNQKTAISTPAPQVLRSRANPLIRLIEAKPGELTISLYDNGEVDGDTVSIYHNNKLIVSKARLSQKPITFQLKVDATQPYHELIMVADNLGSIPPNTSLMIVTANDKIYKVFISSSEQKNARVVVMLKE